MSFSYLDSKHKLDEVRDFINLDFNVRIKFLTSNFVYTDEVTKLFIDLINDGFFESDLNFFLADKINRLHKRFIKYKSILEFIVDFRNFVDGDESLFWVVLSFISTAKSYDRTDVNEFFFDSVLSEDIEYGRYLSNEFNIVMLTSKRRMKSFYDSIDFLSNLKCLRYLDNYTFNLVVQSGRPFQSTACADLDVILRKGAKEMLVLNEPKSKKRLVERLYNKYLKLDY